MISLTEKKTVLNLELNRWHVKGVGPKLVTDCQMHGSWWMQRVCLWTVVPLERINLQTMPRKRHVMTSKFRVEMATLTQVDVTDCASATKETILSYKLQVEQVTCSRCWYITVCSKTLLKVLTWLIANSRKWPGEHKRLVRPTPKLVTDSQMHGSWWMQRVCEQLFNSRETV